jgi:hypothetical protein
MENKEIDGINLNADNERGRSGERSGEFGFNELWVNYMPNVNALALSGYSKATGYDLKNPRSADGEVVNDFVGNGFGDVIKDVDFSVLLPVFLKLKQKIFPSVDLHGSQNKLSRLNAEKGSVMVSSNTKKETDNLIKLVEANKAYFTGFTGKKGATREECDGEFRKIIKGIVETTHKKEYEMKQKNGFYEFIFQCESEKNCVRYNNSNTDDRAPINADNIIQVLGLGKNVEKAPERELC